MDSRRIAPLLALSLGFLAPGLAAQDPHAHAGAPPETLGRVVFPTSCSAEAQPRFERAVALLHSFWWDEAARAFDAVAEADPRCAMAYWGKAMTLRGNPFAGVPGKPALEAGLAAVERGLALDPPTPRERGYVEAVARIYRDHERLDSRTRLLAYEEAMREVHESNPDDPEAAVFYALAVAANAPPTDLQFERQKRAAALLRPLFQARPDHPGLAHYLIHAHDAPPLAHLAVDAARRYAEIAPSVPHALHMPSHVFTRLGMWDESIEANRASAASARAYEERQGATAASFDRVHAWDYLVYAYLQQGRDAEARRILEEGSAAAAAPSIATDYGLAAIPARYALERGRWADAARLAVRPSPGFRPGEGITLFARGIGAARSSLLPLARGDAAALAVLRDTLQGRGDAYWTQVVEAQRQAVLAWIAHREGRTEEALRLAAAAAELEEKAEKHPVTPGPILPARELEGDLLLELGRPADALRAYEATLAREPNRARALFGAARAAELSGDRAAARRRYGELTRLMRGADRPELRVARAFLARP
jgi:tetratricopeptide (TPR) repeat protein